MRISFDAALFHWLESLTGATLGKTVPAHRQEYTRLFGAFDETDRASLEDFARVRVAHAQAPAPPLAFRGMNAMRETLLDGDEPDPMAALAHLARFYHLYGTTLIWKAFIMLVAGVLLLAAGVLLTKRVAQAGP